MESDTNSREMTVRQPNHDAQFVQSNHLELDVVAENSDLKSSTSSTSDLQFKVKKCGYIVCKSAALLVLAIMIAGLIATSIALYVLKTRTQVSAC